MRVALCVVVAAALVVNGEGALAGTPSPNATVTFVDSTPGTSAQILAASTDPFFSATISLGHTEYAAMPGGRVVIDDVTVTNTSQTAWPGNVDDSVHLTYEIVQGGTVVTPMGFLWSSDPGALLPGESGTFRMAFDPPATFGAYTVRVDLVRGPSTARTYFGSVPGNITPTVTFYVNETGTIPPVGGGGTASDLALILTVTPTSVTTGAIVNAVLSLTNTSAASQRVTFSAKLVYTGARPYQTSSPSTQFTLGAGKKIGASLPFKITSAMPRGTYALTVTATDASGPVSATVTLTVR